MAEQEATISEDMQELRRRLENGERRIAHDHRCQMRFGPWPLVWPNGTTYIKLRAPSGWIMVH
jgi:hypothetical protein